MRINKSITAIILAGLALALTGCETVEKYSLTYRLWDNSDLSKWSEPVANSNLALFEATNCTDVLVRYDAYSESRSAVQQRAYYLQPNQARIVANRQPKFVPPTAADGMTPIPILSVSNGISNVPPASATYVVTNSDNRGFTLYQPIGTTETFDLPVYPETSGVPVRVALTPLAVAGDTVMVGVVSAGVAFYWWLASGAPGANHH